MNSNEMTQEAKTKEQELIKKIQVAELGEKEGLVFFGTCHCSGRA